MALSYSVDNNPTISRLNNIIDTESEKAQTSYYSYLIDAGNNNNIEYNLITPSECLVYIENRQKFADVDGSTQIARQIRDYIERDILYYDLILRTDSDGDRIEDSTGTDRYITVTGDRILTDRAFHDIPIRKIYHFATLTLSSTVEYPIEARGFVIKTNLDKPLESTSRTALGSGIYGLYLDDPEQISSLVTDPNQSVYIIDCENAYPLQDKEHGESLTIASLNTNRYLDRIIQFSRKNPDFNETTFLNITQSTEAIEKILGLMRINQSPNILTLWNIVLYRTQDRLQKEELDVILAQYIVDYLSESKNNLTDTVDGTPLHELPINYIMRSLGYDGIIASDIYNNGWNRGCVSYNYLPMIQTGIIRGQTARY